MSPRPMGVVAARLPVLLGVLVLLGACSSAAATPLPAGTYTSEVFAPSVTYTVPAGWSSPRDTADYLGLMQDGSTVLGVHLFRSPLPASQDAACPSTPEPGVGTTARDLVDWVAARPGLVVSEPKTAALGGLTGHVVDVAIASGWTSSCPFASGLPSVPLFVGAGGSFRWVVAGAERLRLSFLDVPSGGTVVVAIDDFDGKQFDALVAEATPIVESMRFAGP